MIRLDSFEDRFEYLQLRGYVGRETFGFDRYLNQRFYKSYIWERTRDQVIARDYGCDLADPDRPIHDRVYIHHIIPMTPEDLRNENPLVIDLDNLVTVSFDTHQAIHYGNPDRLRMNRFAERRMGDTDSW